MNSNKRPELSHDDARTFDGTPVFCTLEGPRKLLRLCGTFDIKVGGQTVKWDNDPRGRWWFTEQAFLEILDMATNMATDAAAAVSAGPDLLNHILSWVVREKSAVCADWNSLANIYSLNIPTGEKISCWAGHIRAQPLFSKSDPHQRKSALMLPGGLVQYVIDGLQDKRYDGWVRAERPLRVAVGTA